jgi:hypothetical protein
MCPSDVLASCAVLQLKSLGMQAIRNKLQEQGVPVMKVALYGYVESPGTNIISTSVSPKKTSKSANGSRPGTADTPDNAVAAYKQRMSTSNVTFS